MALNPRDLKRLVDKYFDLPTILVQMGVDIPMVPCTLCCPFHDDNSKSAKVFEDNHLYCWTCQKQYGPYEALLSVGVTHNQMTRALMEKGVDVTPDEEKVFSVDLEAAKALKVEFRMGRLTLVEYLEKIMELL